MKTTLNVRRLTHALALLSLFGAAHLQAQENLSLAEGGSDRALEQSRKAHESAQLKLAEGGSDRALERSRKLRDDNPIKLAEGGSDRVLAAHRSVRA
jgi:hypothetical protein